jgi:hypothetical protein
MILAFDYDENKPSINASDDLIYLNFILTKSRFNLTNEKQIQEKSNKFNIKNKFK